MANKHMERCPTSSVIRAIQIKTTMRYHYTCITIVTTPNAGKSGELDHSYSAGENVKGTATLASSGAVTYEYASTTQSSRCTLSHLSQRNKSGINTKVCTYLFTAVLFIITQNWN